MSTLQPGPVAQKFEAIRLAARSESPSPDIRILLSEIQHGRLADEPNTVFVIDE